MEVQLINFELFHIHSMIVLEALCCNTSILQSVIYLQKKLINTAPVIFTEILPKEDFLGLNHLGTISKTSLLILLSTDQLLKPYLLCFKLGSKILHLYQDSRGIFSPYSAFNGSHLSLCLC